MFLADRPRLAAFLTAALLSAGTSIQTPASAASIVLPPSCNVTAAAHYSAKGIDFMHKLDFSDASYAFASGLQMTAKCKPPIVVNAAWVYQTMSNLASSELAGRNYRDAETLIKEARDYRAKMYIGFYQGAELKGIYRTDHYLNSMEQSVIEAKAAELAREQYRLPYVPPAEATSGAPDCDDYTIDEVHRDGKVITMLDGAVFLVDDPDEATSSIWLTADDVKACSNDGRHFKLIDGDDDVYATKVQ